MNGAWPGIHGRYCAILLSVATGACEVTEELRLARATNSLAIGTIEGDVVNRLGPPSDSGAKFYLGQAQGFEEQYRQAAASSSVRYLFWHGGVAKDVVCAVGFDQNNRVAFRACGGT